MAIRDPKDWHKMVQIGSTLEDRRNEVQHAVESYHKNIDGDLVQISGVSHQIYLVFDDKLNQSEPYHAWICIRDSEKNEEKI